MRDVIETSRLRLRPVALGDAATLFALFNNWNVVRWLSAPAWPASLELTTEHLRRSLQEGPSYEVYRVIEHEGVTLGGISWRDRVATESRPGGPNIGYWLGEPFWGKGYMSEAVAGLVAELFASLPTDVITSGMFVGNGASLRVQQKLGFTVTGESMLFCTPQQAELPHLSTLLTRAQYETRT